MTNVLLIATGNFAQVLCATPSLSILKKNLPQAQVTVLTNKPDIFKNNPNVEQTLRPQTFLLTLKKIRRENFDLAVMFTPSFSMALMLFLCRIKKRLAPQNFYTPLFMTDTPKLPPPQSAHKAKLWTQILAPLFIFSFPAGQVLHVSKKEDEWASKYLYDIGILPKDAFICIHPASPNKFLNWPKQKYAQLIDKIQIKYPTLKILLICSDKKGFSVANEIYWRSIKKPFIIREEIGLSNFIAVLNRAQIIISNYSAPAHIASALGKPAIAFYPALESDKIIKPFDQCVRVLEPETEKCKKCKGNLCHNPCLDNISLQQTQNTFDTIVEDILNPRKNVF